jgi:hypothetical protein
MAQEDAPHEALVIGHSEAATAAGIAGVRVMSPGNAPAKRAAANFLEAACRACDPLAKREGGEAT